MPKTKRVFTRTFDTQTERGLKQAERYKAMLENKGLSVTTQPLGFTRVIITGRA